MDGVEILSQSDVVVATTCNWSYVNIAVGIILAATVGLAILVGIEEKRVTMPAYIVLIGLLMAILATMCISGLTSTPTEYETRYKVTIDDSVSMQEFNEYYEIIEQEGKIYTVREKKP